MSAVQRPADVAGIDYLRAVLRGEYPSPPMCETLPMRYTRIDDGLVEMVATASVEHMNTLGGVHGGFAATLIDTVTGSVVLSKMQPGESYTTISLELKMLRPLPLDEPVYARGSLVNISRRLAVAEGVVRNAEGKVVAQGSSGCMVFR